MITTKEMFMEIKRSDIAKIIDSIRIQLKNRHDCNLSLNIDDEYNGADLIYGVSNEFLSDFIETLTGNKVCVTGDVEDLYICPCCGFKTLTEEYNENIGTGYDICPLCGWEDDGTTDINSVRSINGGSIAEYRKKLSQKSISNKWINESNFFIQTWNNKQQ